MIRLTRLVVAYVAIVIVWDLLRLTPISGFKPFALLDLVGWVLLVPTPILVLACAVKRKWIPLATLVLPVLVFSAEYGARFMPHATPSDRGIRVATANIHISNERAEDVARALVVSTPDVIAVHELGPRMSQELEERLAREYPYHALHPGEALESMGLFSRYPMREIQRPRYEADSCRCQVVEIRRDRLPFTVVNVHLVPPGVGARSFDPSSQKASVDALLDEVRRHSSTIVLGDFNIADRHPHYKRMRSVLGDSFRERGAGFGFTWPMLPVIRIDYVFHTARWETRSAWTAKIPGSDHRLVGAELIRW